MADVAPRCPAQVRAFRLLFAAAAAAVLVVTARQPRRLPGGC